MEFEETVEFEVEYEEVEIEIPEIETETVEFDEDTVNLEDFSDELDMEIDDEMFDEDTQTEDWMDADNRALVNEMNESGEMLDDDTQTEDWMDAEDRALVNEMNESGEMDYKPSDLGDAYYWHDGETLSDTINIDMPYNPDASYDTEDFIGQAQMQEEGLNQMTVAEFLDNYENYHGTEDKPGVGRSPEGSEMQAQYRDGLQVTIADELMEADPNLSAEEAERLAAEELRGGASLHNPDQTAGGDPTEIHAYGSGRANSALGSLWGHDRAKDMYNQILEQTKDMSREEMENTHLNVHFNIHEKE